MGGGKGVWFYTFVDVVWLFVVFGVEGFWEGVGGVEGEVAGGGSDVDGEIAGFGDPGCGFWIVVGEAGGREGEGDGALLAGLEHYFLEGFQFMEGTREGGVGVVNVELDDFGTGEFAGVGDGYFAVMRGGC